MVEYTYDGNGNILTVSETKKDGNTNTIRRTYDGMNRVTSYTDYKGDTVKYSYDELGNLISLTYAGGEIVRYKYYENGALKEVIDTENLVTSYTYDKRGNLLTTSNPDGTTEVNTYDDLGQLTTRTLYKAVAGEGNKSNLSDNSYNTSDYGEEVYSYSYTYDDWGNITCISYTDNLSDIDNFKNISANETDILTSATMTYDSSNRMITYNGEDIEYDADGNMTYGPLGDEMVHFTYDCRNRLIKAGDIEYTYDAEDIRISTSTPAYTEVYTTDSVTSLSRVLEIKRTYKNNGGKNLEHEVYYYGNGLSYEKLYDNQENSVDSELFVYHYDHLGSTKILTDRDGEVTARFSYGTYGELLTTEYISGDSEYGVDKDKGNYTPHISFLYNGQLGVMTDDNGLYYMRARYYNPDIKRFINQDILTGNIGNSTSLNRYSYVEGNPVSCTDPFGLSPLKTLHQNFHKLMFLPGVGRIFAAADAVLYALEGDWENAAISGLFVIPGAQYVFLGLAAGQIVGMYVDELTNDGKRNDVLVENFVEGINDYYGIDKMSDGEIAFVLVTYALSGGYAYSEAQAAKAAEIAELNIRNEVYSYLEPNIDLNYTGGVSSLEELGMLGKGGSGSPKNKTKLWGQEKYVTEKGLNTVKQHLSGEMEADFNNAMIERLENAYKNNSKISGADLDFYSHEIYESMMMKNGMSYEAAHEAAKAYYNAVEFNFYHPDVIKQYNREFSPAWFRFWGIEGN